MIYQIMFLLYLQTGTITMDTYPDGKIVYSIPSIDITDAYSVEIIRYIKIGVFEYDDTQDDPVIN